MWLILSLKIHRSSSRRGARAGAVNSPPWIGSVVRLLMSGCTRGVGGSAVSWSHMLGQGGRGALDAVLCRVNASLRVITLRAVLEVSITS